MKSRVKILLFVAVPLTLALAVAAGIVAPKRDYWPNAVCFWGLAGMLSVVILLWVIRLVEIRKLQHAGLRLGQVVIAISLLGLFFLAVGSLFFITCSANIANFH